LAGEFNHWSTTTTPMQRGDEGKWNAHVLLPLGKHSYKFNVDGERVVPLGVLGFRFNRKFDGQFGVACDVGLVLQISAPFIERRYDRKQNCGPKDHPNEEHEVAGAL
jgi:hypothetical protein